MSVQSSGCTKHRTLSSVGVSQANSPPPPLRSGPTRAMASSFLRFLDHTHSDASQSVGHLWSASQRPLRDNTQHSQQTSIHAPGGMRTHSLSRRAAVDPRLRPRGHWDLSQANTSSGFGGLEVACWPLVPKFAGSNPAEAVGFFRAKKSSVRLPSEGK